MPIKGVTNMTLPKLKAKKMATKPKLANKPDITKYIEPFSLIGNDIFLLQVKSKVRHASPVVLPIAAPRIGASSKSRPSFRIGPDSPKHKAAKIGMNRYNFLNFR